MSGYYCSRMDISSGWDEKEQDVKDIEAAIDIDASPERVWGILTDLPSYVLWNPFIHRAYGLVQMGEKIEVHMKLPGAEESTFFPTITLMEPCRELRWSGHLYVAGLFDREQDFRIEPLGEDRVHFVQREGFTGVLVQLIMPKLEDAVRQGMEAMNMALKERAEAPAIPEHKAA